VQQFSEGQKWTRLESSDGVLDVLSPTANWPLTETLVAAGDGPLGRGARGVVPLHLLYESNDLRLDTRRPVRWRITLRAAPVTDPEKLTSREK